MKTYINLLLLLPILAFASCSGCTTTKENAYKTLSITASTVDTAMKAYADARVLGKVDDATHAKVTDVKRRYEQAFVAAVSAAQANLENPTPTDVAQIAAELVSIINAATHK